MVGTLPAKWCITLVCFKSRAEVIPAVNDVIQCSTVTSDGGQDELINTLNIIWIYISAVVHQQDKQLWYLASKSVQKRIVFNTSVHVSTQAGSFISIFAATKVNRTLRQYFRSGGGGRGHLREVWVEVCRYWAARDLQTLTSLMFFKSASSFTHMFTWLLKAGSFISIFAGTKLNRMLRQYLRPGGALTGTLGRGEALKTWPYLRKKKFILLPFCRRNFFINSNHRRPKLTLREKVVM